METRVESFFEARCQKLESEVQVISSRGKELEWDCAELSKHNSELSHRVKKLASRQPACPNGFRPQRRHNSVQSR